LGPTENVLPEDGDRIQSPKRCILKYKQDGVLDKNRTMDNVQKHNICSSDTLEYNEENKKNKTEFNERR
jgi:hypothetical protein